MSQTTIFFIRHGEVENPKQLIYGRLPGFGLSDTGKKQASDRANFLKDKPISAIYVSPLMRTKETASFIAKHFPHLPIVSDERLIEIRCPFDGKSNCIMFERKWNFYTPDIILAGGERLGEIWKRMHQFLIDIEKNHKGKHILAVSHGDPIMVVRVKALKKRLHIKNMRGPEYIPHAGGIEVVLENGNISAIMDV